MRKSSTRSWPVETCFSFPLSLTTPLSSSLKLYSYFSYLRSTAMSSQHHASQNVTFVLVNHVSYLPLKEKYPFTTLGARIQKPVSTTTEGTSSPLSLIAYRSRSRHPTVVARRTLRIHTGNNLQGPDKGAVSRIRDHSPSEDLKCKHGLGPECESCMAISKAHP